ncbi:MAG TPA: TonB-dependent receptor [Longimicrobium sp.]|nr:TonB-dependent receptor [Longimicrobium sp.]
MRPVHRAVAFAALLLFPRALPAQTGPRVTVHVLHLNAPVPGATVRAGGDSAVTGRAGTAVLALAPGTHQVVVTRAGFQGDTLAVRAGRDTAVTVRLREATLALEAVVATASRSGTILQDQPIRVEAVPAEEIEENQTVAPGGLTTLLEELPGVQIQPSAPGLGGAGLRIRGLPARHTQVLVDGLPLLGQQPGAFGLLQTPPLDLARVEVIKGVASALYGGSALGGVLNLVSRRPEGDPLALAGLTSRRGADAVVFLPAPLSPRLGATLTAGVHGQQPVDVNGDGWADLPRVRRAELRPRVFWTGPGGSNVLATVGGMAEGRDGGGTGGALGGYRESVRTRSIDAGVAAHALLPGGRVLGARASATRQAHRRAFGGEGERDAETTGYAEATLAGARGPHTWVAGAALSHDALASAGAPGAEYRYTTPAVFAQDEVAAAPWLRLAAIARADFQDRYGTFASPRLSALFRPGRGVAVRASAGTGFALPRPLEDEVEAVGLQRLSPMTGLVAERAASASLDAEWSGGGWEVAASAFGTEIRHPLRAGRDPADSTRLKLRNLPGDLRSAGVEALARYVRGPLQAIASYTHLAATEPAASGGRRWAEQVPRDAAELAVLLESAARGRAGVELSYTGRQRIDLDPYRAFGRPFVEVNLLAAINVAGESSIFVNALNLTGVRQTRWDPLLLPAPNALGRRTTDVWAPLAGRTVNLGVKLEL